MGSCTDMASGVTTHHWPHCRGNWAATKAAEEIDETKFKTGQQPVEIAPVEKAPDVSDFKTPIDILRLHGHQLSVNPGHPRSYYFFGARSNQIINQSPEKSGEAWVGESRTRG